MKKFFALILAMLMMVAFSACKKTEDVSNKSEEENVVSNKKDTDNDKKADKTESEKNDVNEESADKESDKEESEKEEAEKADTEDDESEKTDADTKKEDENKTDSADKNDETDKKSESTDKKPEVNDKKPAAADKKPAETDKKPAETDKKPAADNNTPDKKPEVNNTTDSEQPANSGKSLGNKLLGEFKSVAGSGSALSVAEKLSANSELSVLSMGTMEVKPGLLTGFDNNEITGFKEGAMFAPMMGTIPFVGYVFTLEDGADASAFISKLKSSSNRRWNICTEAEETVAGSAGNKVFFVMCNKSLSE